MKNYLPSLPQVSRETLAVLAATIAAAWIVSRFPKLQKFVTDNSFTVR